MEIQGSLKLADGATTDAIITVPAYSKHMDIIGGYIDGNWNYATGDGIEAKNPGIYNLRLINVDIRYINGTGIYLVGVNVGWIVNCKARDTKGPAIRIGGCTDIVCIGTYALGALNGESGWKIEGGSKSIRLFGCKGNSNTGNGLWIANATVVIVVGGHFDNNDAYGINESSPSDYNIIALNDVRGNTKGAISYVGSNSKILRNVGYVAENKGTATISAGSTSVTVSHGLAATPSKVLVTPIGDPGDRFWVANVGSSSFDIAVATAPGADIDFYWYAEV